MTSATLAAPEGSVQAATALPGTTGIIGIGNMGLAIALRLCDAGWPVRVHDLDPAREALAAAVGATAARSPAGVAHGCAQLLVVVVDAAQTQAVLFGSGAGGDGAAAALPPGATVLLCPTIAPEDVERFAARLAAMGLGCIDAPMSGGPARARDGSMSLMLAAPDNLLTQHEALLAQMAARRFHVSPRPGDGARTKLVNNLVAAINLAGAAEGLALAERLGLDAATTLAVMQQSSGQSWIAGDRLPRALGGDFEPRAHVRLLAKDSALALTMAQAAGVPPLPLGAPAAGLFQAALQAGWAEHDDARLFSLLQAHLARRSLPA